MDAGQFTTLEYRPGGELQLPGAERARAQAPLPAERGLAQRAPLVRLNLRSLASLAGSTFWVLSDVGQTLKKIPAGVSPDPGRNRAGPRLAEGPAAWRTAARSDRI